jgi:Tol biopolymer transport system component
MFPTMSYDGRYVAFSSIASNLVAGDHNNAFDVFVRDRKLGRTERVSVDSSGRERGPEESALERANDRHLNPSISGNGRFVSFKTSAGNLAPGDDNRSHDMFVHDRVTRRTERITSAPSPANVEDDDQPHYVQPEPGVRQALSFDGRYVAFSASPLPPTGPSEVHIFVYDRRTGTTKLVDVSSSGEHAENGANARSPALSADGRYVVFFSAASNLVEGDDNEATDVFVRDLKTNTTIRLTGAPAAAQGPCSDCGGARPSISADGMIVAFESTVVNAVLAPDTGADQIFVNDRSLSSG